jgi:hypothetical protein
MAGLSVRSVNAADWNKWVLKVEVVRTDGIREIGSGVVIAKQRLVTNCHVVRNARTIKVSRADESWTATMDMGDEYRDLCFLHVPDYPGNAPPIGEPGDAKVGVPVYAAGYSGGSFGVSNGHVKGLFSCECDGGRVIQTSAPFNPGASGGGLFDEQGRLLGILTFKSNSGGDFHFALPVGWMKQLSTLPFTGSIGKSAFWANPMQNSTYFLTACNLDAQKKWQDLSRLAREWVRHEPYNPQAWMSLGRANLGIRQLDAAASDFQQVLALDSTHSEASWELEKLEIDLGRSLLLTGNN